MRNSSGHIFRKLPPPKNEQGDRRIQIFIIKNSFVGAASIRKPAAPLEDKDPKEEQAAGWRTRDTAAKKPLRRAPSQQF